jgi:hypothetical protein
MPVPVSVTQIETYPPTVMSRVRASCSLSSALAVSIVRSPRSGMASRALAHRLSIALSSWFGSHHVCQRSVASTVSTLIWGPTVRRTRSSIPETSVFAAVVLGVSICWREKARSP